MTGKVAFFHLPGMYEFFDFYKEFLPLFRNKREYFYEWAEIGSIYGSPMNCIWSGGRIETSDADDMDVIQLLNEYDVSARLTLSNSLLNKEHLSDIRCNKICDLFYKYSKSECGIIIHSDLLLEYLSIKYPDFYFISSTTKVITDFEALKDEVDRKEFKYVVPDFRHNKSLNLLDSFTQEQKNKIEFLCNECCSFGCRERKECYKSVSHIVLYDDEPLHRCSSAYASEGYVFSKAMENPGFISVDDIKNTYMPLGFENFKIEGRSLGSALILEFILYYMTKPEYQLKVREEIYLNHSLDLF